MRLPYKNYYICWSPRILPIILNEGFELWVDPEGKQENPFLDIKKRYDENGVLREPKTGYIFEKTESLMELVEKHSNKPVNHKV